MWTQLNLSVFPLVSGQVIIPPCIGIESHLLKHNALSTQG